MQERQFSTGSIEAPDPYDKHLDKIGYYRKHTARDSTCLFRVISEQMYNAQIYHDEIREICVNYMTLNRSTYEELIVTDLDFDDYLTKMSKPRTFGTLAELHALAYRFKRNVLLFDAFSSGSMYVSEADFSECFLVFYTPLKHFDSVFPKSFIESVAFCQSLTYEIIYSQVFKLPDVIYAVERMLHDPEEGTHVSQIEVSPYDESQENLTLSDGRHFILDHADETECILENYLLCHFHNKQFDQITMQLHHDFCALHNDPDACVTIDHVFGALLPRHDVSCVRQLLDENITPFSYKVAKALDSHIYRNIEFDVWNEARKNTRFKQWPQGDTLQVGIKCLVDNIHRNQKSSYSCHIQEMSPHKGTCVVFVETLGDYRTVPFSSIKTIPNVSWMIPSHQARYRDEKKRRPNFRPIRDKVSGEPYKNNKKKNFIINEEKMEHTFEYFTKPLHIPQQYCEYIASPQIYSSRPKNSDNGGGNNPSHNKNNKKQAAAVTTTETKSKSESAKVEYESTSHFGTQTNVHSGNINNDLNAVISATKSSSSNIPPNTGYATGRGDAEIKVSIRKIAATFKRKDLLPPLNQVNMDATQSSDYYGNDLPQNVTTLRFFYNLGVEFLWFMNQHFPAKTVSEILDSQPPPVVHRSKYPQFDNSNDMVDLTNDFYRFAQISSKDLYSHKSTEGGNRRSYYGPSTPNPLKKNYKSNRNEYSKSKRPFADDPAKYQGNYNKTLDYSIAASNSEANSRSLSADGGFQTIPYIPQAPPPPFVPYHPAECPDPTNMYLLGAYPTYPHENMVAYPMQVPSGMGMAESLSDENDLAQTYPFYNPAGTYYYHQPMPFHPMPMPPQQGCWYPQPMQIPPSMPQTIPTSIGTPLPTSSVYAGHYAITGTSDNHSNNNNNNTNTTTSVSFTPNEPLTNSEHFLYLQKWSENANIILHVYMRRTCKNNENSIEVAHATNLHMQNDVRFTGHRDQRQIL